MLIHLQKLNLAVHTYVLVSFQSEHIVTENPGAE